jgi:hypothetical protein
VGGREGLIGNQSGCVEKGVHVPAGLRRVLVFLSPFTANWLVAFALLLKEQLNVTSTARPKELYRVVRMRTYFSEKNIDSIFRVEN